MLNLYHESVTESVIHSSGLPPVKCRMPFLDRNEHATARVADLTACYQLGFNGRPIFG